MHNARTFASALPTILALHYSSQETVSLTLLHYAIQLKMIKVSMRKFTSWFCPHLRYGTESQLLLILRSLIVSTNRQKIQRALETDAQIQMEQLVRELLLVSIPRLKMRHQHLQILQISMCLSSYAALWLPEYGEIFDVFAAELVARINRARRRQNLDLETDLGENLPFILASYAKASCMHPVLFDTALSWCEEKIGMTLWWIWRDVTHTHTHAMKRLLVRKQSMTS